MVPEVPYVAVGALNTLAARALGPESVKHSQWGGADDRNDLVSHDDFDTDTVVTLKAPIDLIEHFAPFGFQAQ